MYGLITGVVITCGSLFLIRVIAPFINEERWTLGKQILWNTFLMICITVGNVLVTQWMHDMVLPVSWYFTMMKWVFILGVLPIGLAELITYNHFLQKNLRSAAEMSHQMELLRPNDETGTDKIVSSSHSNRKQGLVTFFPERRRDTAALYIDTDIEDAAPTLKLTGENQGDVLEIDADSVLAVQALDNYVNVFYEQKGRLQTAMLRNTLTNIADQAATVPDLYRSHRGWLVNTKRVIRVDGNAQGLKLTVEHLPNKVPVSRSNIAGYRQVIGSCLADA